MIFVEAISLRHARHIDEQGAVVMHFATHYALVPLHLVSVPARMVDTF